MGDCTVTVNIAPRHIPLHTQESSYNLLGSSKELVSAQLWILLRTWLTCVHVGSVSLPLSQHAGKDRGVSLKALQCHSGQCSTQHLGVLLLLHSCRETCSVQAVSVIPWGCINSGKALQYLGLCQNGCSDTGADHLCQHFSKETHLTYLSVVPGLTVRSAALWLTLYASGYLFPMMSR